MTKQNPDAAPHDREFIRANGTFDLFANGIMWSPYWTVAKALLHTQRNTFAYIEANRRLVDAMRTFVRKEQNLALEISDMVLISQSDDINGAFDRAVAGIRELGEFWIDAQMRSLDVMRSRHATPPGDTQEGAAI